MSINWPASFPSPTISSYSIAPEDSIAKTQMDSGTARQRQRFTSVPHMVNARWIMSDTIFGLFQSWYLHKAKQGAEWILINLQTGLGFLENTARFTSSYDAKTLGNDLWEVNAKLEVRDLVVLTVDAISIILDDNFPVEDLTILSGAFHTLIHTTLPTTNTW